uniref:Uncharacterized protein n=1 Tax=uncultured Armatimonadetes bacterium TaxID=157466 RepID=A0A6J4HQA9_9BACT|nr:hypothetical protein AVDCRST_MAG63-905 [uncultured Armatimonadetes bacterium]
MLGVNRLLGRLRPGWVFSPQEIVALYVAVAVATNLAGHDVLQILFTTLTYIVRRADIETGWQSDIVPYLPGHLFVQDRAAIDALYRGNSTLYRWDHIQPWLAPLGWWTLFTLLLVWTMLCLTTLFRRQWEAEKLTYPIAELPLYILTEERTLFRAPALWVGIAVGAVGQTMNLVHALFPSVPALPIGIQVLPNDVYPWSAAGPLTLSLFPFAIGLAFLLPTQLAFSCLFFFAFNRAEMILSAMLGYGYLEQGKFPYVEQQGVGAAFGIFVSVVWVARKHLARVWEAATGGAASALDDSQEALSYRTAVFGLMAGVAGLVWFAVAAGMQWGTALCYLGILFVVVVVVARLRAELGLPTFGLGYTGSADQVMQNVAGTNAWSRGDLTGMAMFFWLTRTQRQFPMQTHVDAMHLGRRTNTPLRSLSVVILGGSALGIVAAFWAFLSTTYRVGYETANFQGPAIPAFGHAPWQQLHGWLRSPPPPDAGTVKAYVFGAAFTLVLSLLRSRVLWWPLHPAGYLIATNYGVFRLWLPIFLGWMVKSLLLRYGGLGAYRRALPFFIGLVLGEFSAAFLRSVLDLAFDLYLPPSSGIGGL